MAGEARGSGRKPRADGTVGKAVAVLEQVALRDRPARFSELLAESPYPKATLYRLLQTLTNQGLLAFEPNGQVYAPGVRLLRLAHAAWRRSSLAPVARPHLEALARDLGETVHLAQLDHAQVLYLDKANAREPVEMFSAAGKVGPAYCTGVGKAMLAFVPDAERGPLIDQQSFHRFTPATITTREDLEVELGAIRRRGVAFDREEHEPGIICVALPVLARSGRMLGALSVTSTIGRSSLAALEALAPRIRSAVERIAEDVESWRFPDESTPIRRTGS